MWLYDGRVEGFKPMFSGCFVSVTSIMLQSFVVRALWWLKMIVWPVNLLIFCVCVFYEKPNSFVKFTSQLEIEKSPLILQYIEIYQEIFFFAMLPPHSLTISSMSLFSWISEFMYVVFEVSEPNSRLTFVVIWILEDFCITICILEGCLDHFY